MPFCAIIFDLVSRNMRAYRWLSRLVQYLYLIQHETRLRTLLTDNVTLSSTEYLLDRHFLDDFMSTLLGIT